VVVATGDEGDTGADLGADIALPASLGTAEAAAEALRALTAAGVLPAYDA
jgi:hypothetical protein